MKHPLQALFWEMTWRNWIVFPALILFFFGAWLLGQALHQALPEAGWTGYARGCIITLFFTSILLAFAPFTLMESHGGARMSSMTLRWFALPVSTVALVVIPLLVAYVIMAAVVAAWTPLLSRVFQGIDMFYMGVVYLAGVGLAQALAWWIPRKPAQFCGLMAILLPLLFLASILPQDNPMGDAYRARLVRWFAMAIPCMMLLSLWAAHRNRTGDWPGEIPLMQWMEYLRKPAISKRRASSPATVLFWSETVPALRMFLLTWGIYILLILGWIFLSFAWSPRTSHLDFKMIAKGSLEALPVLSVLWPLGWGMILGCETGFGFQTRLPVFLSTRPVMTATLAGSRILTLVLCWASLWSILFLLYACFLGEDRSTAGRDGYEYIQRLFEMLGIKALFTASAMVGALPWLMTGRVEGFPKVLLATLLAWVWTFVLTGYAFQENPPASWASILGLIVGVKLVAAGAGLGLALKREVVDWRFPVALLLVWGLLAGLLTAYFHGLKISGWLPGLTCMALLPLVRLAWCPLALFANRHR